MSGRLRLKGEHGRQGGRHQCAPREAKPGDRCAAARICLYLSLQHNGQPLEVSFDDFTVTHGHSAIVQADDYYPFGMTFNGYRRENSLGNKYLYNGKEFQNELGLDWYDYGARMYDPAVGRFFTQDRFAEKYLDFSPYQYAANNPILYIDMNGDSIIFSQAFLKDNNSIDIFNKWAKRFNAHKSARPDLKDDKIRESVNAFED